VNIDLDKTHSVPATRPDWSKEEEKGKTTTTINLILEVIQLVTVTHDPTSRHLIEKGEETKKVKNSPSTPYCELYKDIPFSSS
jgi:hypothetical protein